MRNWPIMHFSLDSPAPPRVGGTEMLYDDTVIQTVLTAASNTGRTVVSKHCNRACMEWSKILIMTRIFVVGGIVCLGMARNSAPACDPAVGSFQMSDNLAEKVQKGVC